MLGKRENGELFAQTFYNDGNQSDWLVKEEGRTLIWSGVWPKSSDSAYQVRYTASFEDAGNTLVGKWEQSRDGQTWHAFLDARATKAQSLPDASIGP